MPAARRSACALARFPFETWSLSVAPKVASSSSLFLRFLELPSSATGGGRSRHLKSGYHLLCYGKKKEEQSGDYSSFLGADNLRLLSLSVSARFMRRDEWERFA